MSGLLSKQEAAEGRNLSRSQPESAGQYAAFLERLRERTVAATVRHEQVRTRLQGRRHAVVALDYREDALGGNKDELVPLAEVGIYDYQKDVLCVALINLSEGTLVDLLERQGVQPPISTDETAAARGLALRSEHLTQSLNRVDLDVVAFPTPRYRLDAARARHRCATLYFFPQQNRHDVTEVVVDLSAQELVPEEELNRESLRMARVLPDSGPVGRLLDGPAS